MVRPRSLETTFEDLREESSDPLLRALGAKLVQVETGSAKGSLVQINPLPGSGPRKKTKQTKNRTYRCTDT